MPLVELKHAVQSLFILYLGTVLSKRRCNLILKLRSKLFFFLAFKQLHKTDPPYTLCETIRYCIFNEKPYDFDYCLSFEELDNFKLPQLVQSTVKDRKVSGFNRETHISRNPSSTLRNYQLISQTGQRDSDINSFSMQPRRRLSTLQVQRNSGTSNS